MKKDILIWNGHFFGGQAGRQDISISSIGHVPGGYGDACNEKECGGPQDLWTGGSIKYDIQRRRDKFIHEIWNKAYHSDTERTL